MARIQSEALQREIDRIDAGGDAILGSQPAEQQRPRPTLEVAVRVRLSAEQYDRLRCVAESHAIGPSTLMRMWVVERMNTEAPARR